MRVTCLTYCGPYVECNVEETTSTCTVPQCPNANCPRHKHQNDRDKFCPECGSAIQSVVEMVIEDAVGSWELEEEFGGAMLQPFFEYPSDLIVRGVHIWVGGKGREEKEQNARSFWVYEDDQSLDEVRPEDIEAELEQFAADYQDELKQLRGAYGTDEVTVKWGILHAVDW